MKSFTWLFVSLIALSQISCADFFNSESKKAQPPAPRGKPGANPFPADYDPTTGPFSESKMLAHIGLNLISPLTRELRIHIENLGLELDAWRQALQNEDATAIASAQEATEARWRRAMLTFHKLDAVHVGPLTDAGGMLGQNIYGWPDFNACGIDLEMVKYSSSRKAPSQLLYTLKGLGAIEYLLFEKSLDTQCNRNNPRNRPAVEWTAKATKQKWMDRVRFAQVLNGDLLELARRLELEWDPEGANFAKVLIDGSRYPSLREATNALSDAIFSIESVKDRRLGRPLGLHKDCLNSTGKCPESIEHIWSGISLDAIQARLESLLAVVRGGRGPSSPGFGLDDLLSAHGRQDVAEGFVQVVESALTRIRELELNGPLSQQIQNMDVAACRNTTTSDRLVPICAFFQDIRFVSTFMKTEFLTALSLRAPPKFQGDND